MMPVCGMCGDNLGSDPECPAHAEIGYAEILPGLHMITVEGNDRKFRCECGTTVIRPAWNWTPLIFRLSCVSAPTSTGDSGMRAGPG